MTLLLGFAAVNTGNNLLFLIVSALLAFMAVSGIAGWQNIRGLQITVELPDEIYAGLATLATMRIKNSKKVAPSFLLNSTLLGNTVTTYLLKCGASETNSFVHTFAARGPQTIPRAEIRSPIPVNFFVRCRRIELYRKCLVFPTPLSFPGSARFEAVMKTAGSPSNSRGNQGEISRIADYTGKEPMKLIHWRLSAKHEEFKVKELNASSGEPFIIDIDSLPGKDLEENLSIACHMINRLIALNRPVGLKLGERTIGPALSREHRLNLLAELALYGKD
jgi:uncharacterized protein (DUF58 family)